MNGLSYTPSLRANIVSEAIQKNLFSGLLRRPSSLRYDETPRNDALQKIARKLLKRKVTAVVWQSAQPHPEWQY
jgi:hypothetical protein